MVDVNDYSEEKSCAYKDEEYLVRDNGAVLRKARPNQRVRKLDNEWTFGKLNSKTGYLEIASVRVHRIVALAFQGQPPTKEHIVDHMDTNRQNNRPSNLRWITRLENALKNEFTRKKIEYLTGVSIFEFLENPAAYRDCFDTPDFSWMRRVNEEEAKICLDNLKKLGETKKTPNNQPRGKMGEWIYKVREPSFNMEPLEKEQFQDDIVPKNNITDSLTPTAKQLNWNTPTEFVCCPIEFDGDPIECYLKNLSKEQTFFKNQYGESKIIKYASVNNKEIVIINTMPTGPKSYAVAKITYENGYYWHYNLGSFFEDKGAEKCFTLAQGLEWTGGDCFDDFC